MCLTWGFVSAAGANAVDTTIVGNGGPGPYSLGTQFVDTATLSAVFSDTNRGEAPPYTYVERENGLLFAEPIDSGVVIRVRFERNYLALPKVFTLYPKARLDSADTAGARVPRTAPAAGGPVPGEKLSVSGYKSVGISLGSLGQMNVAQGLDVTVFGRVAPNTELSAHLSDQGSSFEGTTREISELDLIYITLTNPRFTTTVGDQYVRWPVQGMLSESKKIKGISGRFTPDKFTAGGFGALSAGKFAVETIQGRSGLQGPYQLTGNGEPDIITPIGGTVRVSVDGKDLEEGEDKDYVVDYDLGTITFTPNFLVTDDQIIRVEYEYKTFDYQRVMVGTDVGFAGGDSALTVRGALWYETDNKDQPIDLDIPPGARDSMKTIGDKPFEHPVSRPVDPQDVAEYDRLYHLYKPALDSVNNRRYFRYTPFDPDSPGNNRNFYRVEFRRVPAGAGEYVVDSTDYRGPIYRYVGPGNGGVTADLEFPLPRSTAVGEIQADIRPVEWLEAHVGVAGQSVDKNLFSDRDDDDNNGAAGNVSLRLGRRRHDQRSLWFQGDHHLVTRRFAREVFTAHEERDEWHREEPDTAGVRRQVWQAGGGATVLPGVSAALSYGQYRRESRIETDRIRGEARVQVGQRLLARYHGSFFRHPLSTVQRRSREDDLGVSLTLDRTEYTLRGFDEWRTAHGGYGRGHVGGEAGFRLEPLTLDQTLRYTEFRAGREDVLSPDTGSALLWKQSLAWEPLPSWKLSGRSAWRIHRIGVDTISTVLVHATNEVTLPHSGFATRQDYRINSERASVVIQVPEFVGKGLGSESYNDTLDEYTPDEKGSYYTYERQVYDNSSDRRVRKTNLRASWSFSPQRRRLGGILADLKWRGVVSIEEQVAADSAPPGVSWIPGFLTLSEQYPDSLVPFSYCYYRQSVSWNPDSMPGYHGDLRLKPWARRSRTYREEGIEGRLGVDRSLEQWFFRGEGSGTRFRQRPLGLGTERFTATDISVQLTQKYLLPHDLGVYVKETAGRARKAAPDTEEGYGRYFLVKPGLSWQPFGRGWAEASYTFASVDMPAALDYRMAQGFSRGTSHVIDVFADVRIGEHFNLSASYRGEIIKAPDAAEYDEPLHVMSMEVKALL